MGVKMSKNRKPRIGIAYDFDGTLSPINMQEHDFFPHLDVKAKDFWAEVKQRAIDHNADEILSYMSLMIDKATASGKVMITKEAFAGYGKDLKLFNGVDTWFSRINEYAKSRDVVPEHYVISSGIREMILGTSIAKHFEKIYASSFIYDQHGVATWPGMANNYTAKTQFLFRISKGEHDIWDNKGVNKFYPPEKLIIPFKNMIYIGDGETDIPCMKLVKSMGGFSIAVYKPRGERTIAQKLVEQNRVNVVSPADYSKGKQLEKVVFAVIDRIAATAHLDKLSK
jgi:2-hydroxy-3-keto-5-methylthiopentenyl-1-phosphate phosphatase